MGRLDGQAGRQEATQIGIPPPRFPGYLAYSQSWSRSFVYHRSQFAEPSQGLKMKAQRGQFSDGWSLLVALVSSSLALARPSPAPSHSPHPPPNWVLALTIAFSLVRPQHDPSHKSE